MSSFFISTTFFPDPHPVTAGYDLIPVFCLCPSKALPTVRYFLQVKVIRDFCHHLPVYAPIPSNNILLIFFRSYRGHLYRLPNKFPPQPTIQQLSVFSSDIQIFCISVDIVFIHKHRIFPTIHKTDSAAVAVTDAFEFFPNKGFSFLSRGILNFRRHHIHPLTLPPW